MKATDQNILTTLITKYRYLEYIKHYKPLKKKKDKHLKRKIGKRPLPKKSKCHICVYICMYKRTYEYIKRCSTLIREMQIKTHHTSKIFLILDIPSVSKDNNENSHALLINYLWKTIVLSSKVKETYALWPSNSTIIIEKLLHRCCNRCLRNCLQQHFL